VRGRPFQRGPDPRRRPGRKGRSGRRPDSFHAECAANVEAALPKLRAVLDDATPADPHFRWAFETCAKYGFNAVAPTGASLAVKLHEHNDTDAQELLLAKLNEMASNLAAAEKRTPSPAPSSPPGAAPSRPRESGRASPGPNGSDESGPARIRWRIP
jgi:hypothetical protein